MRKQRQIGYVRVSSTDQNEDRQIIALTEAGIKKDDIFMDKLSGKDFNRPEYQRMLEQLNEDTVLYVLSIDRLGRNYNDLTEQWRIITKEKKADICVLDMPLLDTRRDKDLLGTLISDLVLALLSYSSESERNAIKARQAEGIAAARARGMKFGRPVVKPPSDFEKQVKKWEKKEITLKELKTHCGMSDSTFYRRLRELRLKRELEKNLISERKDQG